MVGTSWKLLMIKNTLGVLFKIIGGEGGSIENIPDGFLSHLGICVSTTLPKKGK